VPSGWRHLDLGTWQLEVRAALRRLRCPTHGVVVEGVPFARPGAHLTRARMAGLDLGVMGANAIRPRLPRTPLTVPTPYTLRYFAQLPSSTRASVYAPPGHVTPPPATTFPLA
jgi:hypothetical protein